MTNIKNQMTNKSKTITNQNKILLNLYFLRFIWILSLGFWILSSIATASTTIDPSRTVYLGKTLGMGGAHVALSNDGEGLFVNPSGLSDLKFPQLTGLSRKLFLEETAYSLYGFSFPTDYGSFGIGYVGANTGGSYATTRDNDNRIAINPSLEAIANDNTVFMISYAKKVPAILQYQNLPLSLGANLKFLNQSMTGGGIISRGSAINLDLSATYHALPWLTAGANLQNILGGVVKWNNSEDKLGGYYKFGLAANILSPVTGEGYFLNSNKVIGAFDVDLPHDVLSGSMLMHGGLEWAPLKYMALRAGINQEPAGFGLTLGIGFIQDAFRFDYAYAARPGIIGDNPHYFSMSYSGEIITTVERQLKRKESALKILYPKDRHITTEESIKVIADAKYTEVYNEKETSIVPVISRTSTTREVAKLKNLDYVYFDGKRIEQYGTIETSSRILSFGRNIIKLNGYITPEAILSTSEVAVLRIVPFNDVATHYWAFEPISLNSTLGLIKGYPDGSFKPEKGITRAELATLLVRTFNIHDESWANAVKNQKFKDIPLSHWAAAYINIAAQLGIVQGYPNGTFGGNKVINRVEGVTVMSRFAKLPEKDEIAFPDLKSGFWGNKFIAAAKDAELLKYLEGKTFESTREFSRAEASEVLYRTKPIQQMVNDFWGFGTMPITGTVPEYLIKKAPTNESTAKPVAKKIKKAKKK